MSDELSNAAKLAIQKYLVAIFLGGFSVFSAVVYLGFINLESSIKNSVDDRVENLIDENQKKFEPIYDDVVKIRRNVDSESKKIDGIIKEVQQKMEKLNSVLEKATQIESKITKINNNITEFDDEFKQVKDIVKEARTDAAKRAGQNLTLMQTAINKLSEEIKLVSSKVEGAHGEKIARSDVSDDAKSVNVEGPTKLDEPNKLWPCDPLNLRDEQIKLIFIEQRVESTETFSRKDRRYYRNIFSVAIRQDGSATVPMRVRKCILDAIDGVDYILSEYWFKPPRRQGSTRDANFRYKIRVWGVTSVSAEIHLKGNQPTLKKRGQFSVSDGEIIYFESENG